MTMKFRTSNGREPFEVAVPSVEAAVLLAAVLVRFCYWQEMHREVSFVPALEVYDINEDGDEVCVASMALPHDPPWRRD